MFSDLRIPRLSPILVGLAALLLSGCNGAGTSNEAGQPSVDAPKAAGTSTPAGAALPRATPDNSGGSTAMTQTATFGAGCFWGVEERFRQTPGVVSTAVGYMGGAVRNPTYQQVCTDTTGHAEVVQVEFDPARIGYSELLDIYWKSHNPTQLNRQGPDVGSQYRSVIFFHTPEQEAVARQSRERLAASGRYSRPIVTQIDPASEFWRAEEYHQQYLAKRGLSSCSVPADE